MRLIRLMIAAIVLVSSGGCASDAKVYEPDHPIVGVWKLASWRTLDESGMWAEEFGADPKGYFVYSASGYLSIHLMHENGASVSECKPEDFGGEGAGHTFLVNPNCYVGYFGKYRVESDSTVIHLPEGGTILSYIETEQPRAYKLKGDSLWIEWSQESERLLLRLE